MQERIERTKNHFTTSPDDENCFLAIHNLKRKRAVTSTYSIYSLTTLGDLLEEKAENKEEPALNFLVNPLGVIWFAREKATGVSAPAHFEITEKPRNEAQCKTAGNMYFTNANCNELKKINHKSGDFHPSLASLKWFFAILLLNEDKLPFKFSETILVDELGVSNGGVITTHKWDVATIRDWAKSLAIPDLLAQLTNQKHPTKEVTYRPLARIAPEEDEWISTPSVKKPRKSISRDLFFGGAECSLPAEDGQLTISPFNLNA